jgi:hypothetical protein
MLFIIYSYDFVVEFDFMILLHISFYPDPVHALA